MNSNKKLFDQINKEYSFLDDYELELKQNANNSQQPIQNQKPLNNDKNEIYLNNYNIKEGKTHEEEFQEKLMQEKQKQSKTDYGKLISRQLKENMTIDEAYKELDIPTNVDSEAEFIEKVDNKNFGELHEVIQNSEIRFYAFLNKEYNILNKKMIKCCLLCYENPKMFTVYQSKICAETCQKNIKEASKFVENLQEEKKNKLMQCSNTAKDIKNGTDPLSNFNTCYEDLIKDFEDMEIKIRTEFSNYI